MDQEQFIKLAKNQIKNQYDAPINNLSVSWSAQAGENNTVIIKRKDSNAYYSVTRVGGLKTLTITQLISYGESVSVQIEE